MKIPDAVEDFEDGVSRGPYSGCLRFTTHWMDLYEYVNIFICSAVLALLSRNVNEESENKDKWKSRIGCFEVIVMTNKIKVELYQL